MDQRRAFLQQKQKTKKNNFLDSMENNETKRYLRTFIKEINEADQKKFISREVMNLM